MRMQITVGGVTYPVSRDVAHRHPAAVHAAMGSRDEIELQRILDNMNVSDWYDGNGTHLGPDEDGLEMFEDDDDA